MILESGDYYQQFYKNSYQGYWAAFLVESFLTISAMLRIKNNKILNGCIRVVMIPLFLVVVTGASLKVVAPLVDELALINSKNRLINILEKENLQSIKNLDRLNGQRINTALEIRRQRESTQHLKEIIVSDPKFEWMIWIVIGFSTFLRFSIQVANLVFAHTLGALLRETKSKMIKKEEIEEKVQEKPLVMVQSDIVKKRKCVLLLRYLEKNGGKVTRLQIAASRIFKEGIKEYDRILNQLEKTGKITVDRSNISKQTWIYAIA